MSLSQFQAQVVDDCAAALEKVHMGFEMQHYVVFLDDYIVKFKSPHVLYEGDTQAYVYEATLKDHPHAPRVPKVLDCFLWKGTGYLVMERVHHPNVQQWLDDATDSEERQSREKIAHEHVATALRWLFKLPAPLGACIGPIESAFALANSDKCIHVDGLSLHSFFGHDYAPFRYTSARALQNFVNKILTCRPSSAPFMEVDFTDEPLLMVHGDINPSNFLIDLETKQITIIGFGHIDVLPHSFISYTLSVLRSTFLTAIGEHLRVERSKNLEAMFQATYMCCLAPSEHFFIDEDGHAMERPKRVR